MWHTALRQSYDSSRLMNSGQPNAPPDLKDDSFTQPPCDCELFSTGTGKYESAIPRYIPYGGAAQAPRKPVFPNPLPEQPTFHEGGCKNNSLPNIAINNHSPIISSQTDTQRMNRDDRPRRPESEMRQWDGGRRNTRPSPPRDRRHAPPSLGIYKTETLMKIKAHCSRERDNLKRLQGEGQSDSDVPPTLTGEPGNHNGTPHMNT
jgi:hypothetical protein